MMAGKDDDDKEGGSEEETKADKRQDSLKVIFRGRSVGLEWRLLKNSCSRKNLLEINMG